MIRFGTFEADPASGELRKGGRRVNLQEQPFRLLMLLLDHPGEVVTREELRQKLWGETHVDFEEGLNTAVRKLRDAIGDSAANPRFIETLPRRGYRFIAPVEGPVGEPLRKESEKLQPRHSFRWLAFGIAAAAIIGAGWLVRASWYREEPGWQLSPPVQLTRDAGLTTDPVISRDGKLLAYASDKGGGNMDIWVQHIAGGEARRLSDHAADDYQPDISPNGSEVIFRSERDGGGIFAVSILGGDSRMIVSKGYVPRFSPDGSRIAYSLGSFGSGGFAGTLNVYTPATGSKEAIAPGLLVAGPPAWSPDGQFLVFIAAKGVVAPLYLWMSPAEGGAVTQMSPRPVAGENTLIGQMRTVSVAWIGDQIVISAKQGDSSNLWAGTVSRRTRQLAGELKRITLGSGDEVLPSVSADGKLVFANHNFSNNIWEAVPDKNASDRAIRKLTQDRALTFRPSLSGDKSKMVYVSNRTGVFHVWMKDLMSGKDNQLARTPKGEIYASISRDGGQISFWDGENIYLAPTNGGDPGLLCEKCGRGDDWSADGKVIGWSRPSGIGSWDSVTKQSTKLTAHPTLRLTAPNLSPDGKWLTFHLVDGLNRQILIAPYTGSWTPPSNWIAVTDGKGLDREPRFSADGNGIYFLSDRDGFRCIWGRDLDPKTKQPLGEIHPVLHLHNPRLSLSHISNTGNVGISPVGEKLIFAMGELTGNIWMTELHQP